MSMRINRRDVHGRNIKRDVPLTLGPLGIIFYRFRKNKLQTINLIQRFIFWTHKKITPSFNTP